MTKYQLTKPGGPWDYPTLGFSATNGAILDGTLSTPAISVAPDAYWAVYVGGSAETGITRYGTGTVTPTPEVTDGWVLAYDGTANTYTAQDLGDTGSLVGAALSAAIDAVVDPVETRVDTLEALPQLGVSNGGPLGRIWKARDSQFRVHLYGMSIASFDNSPARVIGEQLKRVHGEVGEVFTRGVGLGGSNQNAYLGWEKQSFGGPGMVRARGKVGSTSGLTFYFYGDTLEVAFSRETDSEACAVRVDGVTTGVSGSSPASGAQAYQQKVTWTGTLGLHVMTIDKPTGAGYCYFEHLLGYDSTKSGVMFLDFTLGSTLLKQATSSYSWPAATAPMVNAIDTSGNAGLAAHYDRTDADWFINMHDVNDIADPTTVTTAMTTIVGYLGTNGRHLTNVSSMAGHFAQTSDPQKAGFDAIRALYKSLPLTYNYVTHVDWDGATRMTQVQMDGTAYSDRYYTLPDFIHPNSTGTSVGTAVFAKLLEIPTPLQNTVSVLANEAARRPLRLPIRVKRSTTMRRLGVTVSAVGATDVITFPNAHGLEVGDEVRFNGQGLAGGLYLAVPTYVLTVPTVNSITVSTTPGGATYNVNDLTNVAESSGHVAALPPPAPAGYARHIFANLAGSRIVPYHVDRQALNIYRVLNNSIQSAPTGTDKYGKYKTLTNSNEYPTGNTLYQMPLTTLTIRAAGAVSIKAQAPWRLCAPDGTVPTMPAAGYDGFTIGVDTDSTVEPVVYTMNVIDPTGASEYLTISAAKLYEVCWTLGDLPTLGAI